MPTTYIPTIKNEKAHDDGIWCVDWSRHTNLVASGSMDSTVKLWDGLSATPVEAWSARFHPDGKSLATGSHDGHINVYDIDSGEKVASLATKNNFVMCTAYSNDGKYLAGGAQDGSIYVFNLETNQLAHTLSTHASAVRSLSFAPDNKTLISGNDDKCVYVYDVEHGQLASVLTGHTGWVLSVAANQDSSKQQVASGGADHKIKIWDLTTRSVLETQEAQTDQVWGIAWNPEGNKFVSVSDDCSIQWFASSGSS
ncbi:hypothetical protein [Absidia glauca]|uniref:Uncharacterized protein n=1 Tax=Absidia glauca TaxID=4829 RepID=A0A163KK63_ABSGL|nr:hypothetical protein [Absidia glauca]